MASNDGRWVLATMARSTITPRCGASWTRERRGAGRQRPPWRGHSDTETLVECIAAWGLKATLQKCVGMFALALWDRKERKLHLARDRFGEKPLYYGWAGGDFVFGSELKAIRSHPGFDNEIDRRAVRLLAARTYIPAPLSIYKRLYKLEPGCILTAARQTPGAPLDEPPARTSGQRHRDRALLVLSRRGEAGLADPIEDEDEALEQLEEALAEAIGARRWPTCRSAPSCPAGSIPRRSSALYQKYSPAGAHLLDRLRGSGLQRGRICQGRRRPFRHRA
jgi:asparagine synthase (glutamine-hydrolysing)